jgi:hypothetical protein
MRILSHLTLGIAFVASSAFADAALPGAGSPPAHAAVSSGRVALKVDTSEADAVLAILAEQASGKPVQEESWRRLFSSEPYVRLKKREESFHVGFTDDAFRKFVLSAELAGKRGALASTLATWKAADLEGAATRVLDYLPAAAVIRASVYPVIKPKSNSFVFEAATRPAIFLFLDPEISAAKFENTVAHELHHIGFSSVKPPATKSEDPPNVAAAMEWLGAFGEGFAMLAAAGSPDVHPHATSPAADRERWDRDMTQFDRDLRAVEAFLLEVLDGKLGAREEIDEAGMAFFGVQGPWYTVGYGMAALIEKQDGRAVLIECMADPRKLLATYNRAAADAKTNGNAGLALWSPSLLEKLGSR